jgi:transcriptional regulator, MarR family
MTVLEDLREFNKILVKLFNDILDYEADALTTPEFKDLTNNDIHVISAIGQNTRKNMSMIAQELSVTIGSLTIAINSLVRKGYVIRERSDKDRRVVFVKLSLKGEKAFVQYEDFHNDMVSAMLEDLGMDEKTILMNAMTKIDNWIRVRLEKNKEIKNEKN